MEETRKIVETVPMARERETHALPGASAFDGRRPHPRGRRAGRGAACAIVLVLFGAIPARASADDGVEILIAGWIISEVVCWGAGLTAVIGNSVALARSDRPGNGWIGFGIAGAGANTVIGAIELYAGWNEPVLKGLGFGHLGLAVLDAGLTIGTMVKRSRTPEAPAQPEIPLETAPSLRSPDLTPPFAAPAKAAPEAEPPPAIPAAPEVAPGSAEPPTAEPAPPPSGTPGAAPLPAPPRRPAVPPSAPRPKPPTIDDEPGFSRRSVPSHPRFEIVPLLGAQPRGALVAGLGIRLVSW
jgi:hypothetical protein